MNVNIKVLCTIITKTGRQHQNFMHYWQYKYTSSSKFYALLAIQMDVNIKVLWAIGNTNGCQHQSSMHN